MSDREKVLELVESIIVHAEDERTNRSWESDDIGWKNIDKIWGCSQQLKELLKEQEAVKPIKKDTVEITARYEFDCPCGAPLLIGQPYCSDCGRSVKWE